MKSNSTIKINGLLVIDNKMKREIEKMNINSESLILILAPQF